MLVKSLRANPSVLVFIAFCALFGWQLSSGGRYENEDPVDRLPPPPPGPVGEPPPPPPPPIPRIGIVTFVTDEHSYTHLSLRNKDHYARRHGYDLIVDYEAHSDIGTTWWKYDMTERLIRQDRWDWLWWMDFDTLITNTDIRVLDIIEETLLGHEHPDDVDILTTHDCNGLNTGSFVVRSRESSINFLHDVVAMNTAKKPDDHLSEQDAMAKLIKENPAQGMRTVQVPQWKLNAFPEEIACFDEYKQVWEPGTFVLHFAGAWAHVKGEDPTGQLMKKYKEFISWGDWKELY